MTATVSISDWKAVRKGALRGFVAVTLPSGMIVSEVSIFAKDGRAWAAPPAKPLLDRDGRAMLDASGARRYSQILAFSSAEIKSRWSDAVIAALRASHPEALDD